MATKADHRWDAQATASAAIPAMCLVAILTNFPKFPWQDQAIAPVLEWWHPVAVSGVIAVGSLGVSLMTRRAIPHCAMFAAAIVSIGSWCSWIGSNGWTTNSIVAGFGIVAVIMVAQIVVGGMSPKAVEVTDDGEIVDNRPRRIRETEAVFRKAVGIDVTVTDITYSGPKHARTMMHIRAEIPVGSNLHDIKLRINNIPSALRLKSGCATTITDGDHQGEMIFNVMLQNTLAGTVVFDEPATPSSIYAPFRLASDALGNPVEICLRLYSMLLGGAPDAGKTTTLRAIVTHFLGCPDTVVWVVDLNGGGLSEPFLTTCADGRTKRPGVDWVASEPWEALCMLTAAIAVAKWRKMSPEAIKRKRISGDEVLKVDKDFPAILLIVDEGKELQNVPGAIGALIRSYVNQVGEIGRNEAVRLVVSTLRGTSDAVDKAFRTVAAIRACLQVTEHGEYSHFLDETPPKTAIVDRGVGWWRTRTGQQLVLARSVFVDRAIIDQRIVDTDGFRAVLDRWGSQLIDNLEVSDAIGALADSAEIQEAISGSTAMADLDSGCLYSNRWGRLQDKLDAIGQIDVNGDTPDIQPRQRSTRPAAAVYKPADIVTDYLADVMPAAGAASEPVDDPVDEADPDVVQIGASTTRRAILAALKPGPARVVDLTAAVAEATDVPVSKQRISALLARMSGGDAPTVTKLPDGRWSLR